MSWKRLGSTPKLGQAHPPDAFIDGVGQPAAGFVEAAGVAVGRDRRGLGVLVLRWGGPQGIRADFDEGE